MKNIDELPWDEFRKEILRGAETSGIAKEAESFLDNYEQRPGRKAEPDHSAARKAYEQFARMLTGEPDQPSAEELTDESFQPIKDALGDGQEDNPYALIVGLPGEMELPTNRAFAEAAWEMNPEWDAELNLSPGSAPMWASVSFGEHRVGLEGNPIPAGKFQPGLLENTLQVAHTEQDVKEAFRQHQSYYLLRYVGDSEDPLQRWLALHAVARGFLSVGCLGVLNSTAHTFLPPITLDTFGDVERVQSLQKALPCGLFTNIVHNFADDGTWCVSYGNHLFDMPDLAIFIKSEHSPAAGIYLITEMSNYMYASGKRLKSGENIDSGDTRFTVKDMPEEVAMLKGEGETLMIELAGESYAEEAEDEGPPRYGCIGSMVVLAMAVPVGLLAKWLIG